MAHKIEALQCRCKDCLHWEIIEDMETRERFILCKTCDRKFPVTLHVPAHDHLRWVPADRESVAGATAQT
jgi:hypothetical protein